MGIHSGPVNEVTEVNERAKITGAGINMAQRVMDGGGAGHILLSKQVADDLEQYPQWRSHLHDLGASEVKHGVRISVVNLYTAVGTTVIVNLAILYASTDEKNLAIETLALAAQLPIGLAYGELKLNQQWDPLRGDPRFEKILAALAPKE